MFRPLVIAAVAFASFVYALVPAHAGPAPDITDPEGDVNGWVCPVPGVLFTCTAAAEPYSQPAIDVLSIDFSSKREVLVVDVGVLDLDAPVTGEGTESYDATFYVVAFAIDMSRPVWVNFSAEYNKAGDATRAELVVFIPWGGGGSASRPINVIADAGTNRVRFDTPFAVLNEAIAAVCPECAAVARGSELHWPSGSSAVFGKGIVGRSMIAQDVRPSAGPSHSVTV